MGVWGTGNFDSDIALDVLGLLLRQIINEIRDTFARESLDAVYGSGGEDIITANVDILATLFAHYKVHTELQLEQISRWKQDFVDTYNKITQDDEEDLRDAEYSQSRPKVIQDTFNRLYSEVENIINTNTLN